MWGIYYNSSLSNLCFRRAGLRGKLEQTELSEYCFSPDKSIYLTITWVAKWCERWIDWASWRGSLHPAGRRQGTERVGKGMALSGWQGTSWEVVPGCLQASTAAAHHSRLSCAADWHAPLCAVPCSTWPWRAEPSPVSPDESTSLALPGRKWVQALKTIVAGHSSFTEWGFDAQLSLCPIKKQG